MELAGYDAIAVGDQDLYSGGFMEALRLEGGITVEKAIETDSVLATRLNSVIKGAQVVRSEWTSDDGCVVVLRLAV